MPVRPPPPPPSARHLEPLHFETEVLDVTRTNRRMVERAIFAGLCRVQCERHGRYRVDRFSLRTSTGTALASVSACCAPTDDILDFILDGATTAAKRYPVELAEQTKAPAKAGYEMSSFIAMGYFRRRRRDALTLEATMRLDGDERLRPDQQEHLQSLLKAAKDAGKLTCMRHGPPAIHALHIRDDAKGTILDIEVCCVMTEPSLYELHLLADKALLSGPVVHISSGKLASKPTKKKKR